MMTLLISELQSWMSAASALETPVTSHACVVALRVTT
jgi:hypothetical protein